MKKHLTLFLCMLKIGLMTFGGGYAMIALLENEFVSKRRWIGRDEFLDMVAIAESTPGPIAINAATYIGYKTRGFLGSLISTVAICIPSFWIIYWISLFFDAFLSFKLIAYAFQGIQICVIYLIFSAGINMAKHMKKTLLSVGIFSAVLLCSLLFAIFSVSFSSIGYILISGCIGLLAHIVSTMHHIGGESL